MWHLREHHGLRTIFDRRIGRAGMFGLDWSPSYRTVEFRVQRVTPS
jgi:hypothetical protein